MTQKDHDNYVEHYGQEMYNRGRKVGKSLGVSLLHLELIKHGLGTDAKFSEVLNNCVRNSMKN